MLPSRPIAALLLVCLCLGSCSRSRVEEGSFVEPVESDYLGGVYEAHPVMAASLGFAYYEGRLDAVAGIDIQRRITSLKQQLGRVLALRDRSLTTADAARVRLMDYRIRSELLDLEIIQRWQYDPEFYLGLPYRQLTYLWTREQLRPSERLRSINSVLFELGKVTSAMRSNITSVSEEHRRRGLELGGHLEQLLTDIGAWAPDAAGIDVGLAERFPTTLKQAQESLQRSLAWLQNDADVVPNSERAIGARAFVMKVLFDEMLPISITDLRNISEQSLAEATALCLDQARVVDKDRAPEDVVRELLRPATAGSAPMDLGALVDQALSDTRAQNLAPLPDDTRVRTVKSPFWLWNRPDRLALTPPATQQVDPARTSEPAAQLGDSRLSGVLFYDANTLAAYPPWTPKQLKLAVMEETFPGKMTQAAARIETDGIKQLSTHSAVAGWASYITEVSLDRGGAATDPTLLLLYRQRRLLAAVRMAASIGIHIDGMTVEQAAAMFEQRAFLEPETALEEARRAFRDPGYFTGILGRMEIERLRDDFVAANGDDLLEFHRQYLAQGPVPVPIARAILLP